jgi:hypothetical protein
MERILRQNPGDIDALRGLANFDDSLSDPLSSAVNLAGQHAAQGTSNPANQRLLDLASSLGLSPEQATAANLLLQSGSAQGGGFGSGIFQNIGSQALSLANNFQSGVPDAVFDNIGAHAFALAGANPLAQSAGRLDQLSGRDSVFGIPDIRNLAARAGQVGAAPGAAETVLTPGAVELLSQAQSGQTPEAISRLFASDNTASRQALENQFDAARQRLIDRGVRGGALERALAGLEGQRGFGIASQEADLESQARNATLGLLGQATTFGLEQPFQREQLALQGIQTGGQLEGLAGNLGLSQAQVQGNLANLAGGLRAQNEQLRQGFLGIGLGARQASGVEDVGRGQLGQSLLGLGLGAGQALSGEGIGLQQLRNQALGAAGALGGDIFQNQLASTRLSGDFINENIRNQLAANQAQTANIGLAGQLGAQQIASQLGISQQEASVLSEILNQRSSLAQQLGSGADALRFQTAPGLLTQGVQLDQLAALAPGFSLDLLRGGQSGRGVDLSGALAAIGNAQNFQQGPSQFATGAAGALSGAGSGAMIGSMFGPIGTGIGAGAGGLLGLLAGVL